MPFDQLVHEFIEKHGKVEKTGFKRDIFSGEAGQREILFSCKKTVQELLTPL
jgi:hypothetical protein